MDTIYNNDQHYRRSETDAKLQLIPEWHGGRRIGLAIVGVGRMGAIHLYNALREPRAKLLYLVDTCPRRLEYMRRKYFLDSRGAQTIRLEAWQVVLADERVEALLISTPTGSHEQLVREALEHGKNVICEKPLAESACQIRSLFQLAECNKLKLICAFNRRYDNSIRRLKEQVDRGDIGPARVIKTCSRDSPNPKMEFISKSSGFFQDVAIHDVDFILWIARELPLEVHAYGHAHAQAYAKLEDFDTVVLTIKFASGLLALADLSRVSGSGYEQRMEVFGERGVQTRRQREIGRSTPKLAS